MDGVSESVLGVMDGASGFRVLLKAEILQLSKVSAFGWLDFETFETYFFEFVLSSAALSPSASFTASSFAQKCMKNRRGSSDSM